MRNIFIVLKHEVLTTLSKTSYWVMTFLFPAAVIGLTLGSQVILQKNLQEGPAKNASMESMEGKPFSYVDLSGIIQAIPQGIPAGMLNPYSDLDSAQADLQSGKIEWYTIIPADYVESGDLVMVQRSFNPMADLPTNFFQYLLAHNLAPDPGFAPVLSSQESSTVLHNIAPEAEIESSQGGMAGTLVSYGSLFIFFMLISMSSGLMLNSVSKEKSNLVAEVLLLSLRPRELMAGKLLGLSLLALFQMVTWTGGILLFLDQGKNLIAGLSQINLPDSFLLWAVLFFMLGFLLYASLFGAVGALAPSFREAGQFTFIFMVPLMIPLVLNTAIAQQPNGPVATFFSLFPLTAPTTMMTRLVASPVPLWQTLVSLGGLAVTTYLVVLLSARFFRPETLLSSAALKWPQFLAELRRAVTGRA